MSRTLGPWEAFHLNDDEWGVGVRATQEVVALGLADDEARLIAAAPDLLDAVRNLLAASSPASRRLARSWAEKALIKATGAER